MMTSEVLGGISSSNDSRTVQELSIQVYVVSFDIEKTI
jgi:hypothetical protein